MCKSSCFVTAQFCRFPVVAHMDVPELNSRTSFNSFLLRMEDTDLDITLWRQLPVDLLDKVLTKLPVSTLMIFRQVCTRWNDLIQSAGFGRQCQSVKPIVFFFHPGDNGGPIYGHSFGELISFLAVPDTKSNSWQHHYLDLESVYLVAADQGLLCFRLRTANILFVHNPLTRKWRSVEVPGKRDSGEFSWSSRGTRMLVGLIVDQETGNYKLVVGFIETRTLQDEDPRGTHVYDSLSSTWSSTHLCPEFPSLPINIRADDDENWMLSEWKPGVSITFGGNVYWAVEQTSQAQFKDFFRILVKYDFKVGSWTVDESNLPYTRHVFWYEVPGCLPRNLPYANLMDQPDAQIDNTVPQWNFHLAVHDGTMSVTLFDSLLSRDAFSGTFSTLIPEVKVIDAELVGGILELGDVPERYLPTKVVAQNEMWYVVFEYDGVCGDRLERGQNPLYVVGYDTRQRVFRWLPVLDQDLSRRQFLHQDCRSDWLPEIYTFVASFRALV
ncbi:hypothetical protein R1sor_026585 [Riccia sorocarpa]|uniref:F-box domain-containing protein n=1 Tax=Riccia sorocarpa TaxID=122646 RepID=A0ABD3GBT1_9MARC